MANTIQELELFIQTPRFHSLPEEKQGVILQTLEHKKQKKATEERLAPVRALRRAEQERIDKIRSEEAEKQRIANAILQRRVDKAQKELIADVNKRMEGFDFCGMESFCVEPGFYRTTEYKGTIVFKCYSEPEFTFELLEDISKRLGTRKLNFGNETTVTNQGCDSCQHGREWEFSVSFSCDHQL